MVDTANPVGSDQKKRTLDALERRFALAKAEVLQQQQPPPKNRKQSRVQKEIEGQNKNISSSSSTTLVGDTDKLDTSSLTPLSNKGHFAFSGYTPSRGTPGNSDVEENGLTYSKISQPVHENLLRTDVEPTGRRGSTVDKILHELLQNGDSAHKYMQGSRSMKIDNWILLDNVVQGRGASLGARIKASQSNSKRSRRHMSMKQHKKCGSFELPQEFHKFDYFKPMHEMWKDYVTQLLKNVGKSQLSQCLLTADLHGAILLVVECKITSFTGVSGIMVRETAETFGIITQDNKFRVVPKKASVFIFQTDCWKITLHGDELTSRNFNP